MCGEIEEDGPSDVEQRLHDRFINHARNLLAQYAKAPEKDPGDLNVYMDKLFSDGLSRAARDADGAPDAQHYERLASQPLVFAPGLSSRRSTSATWRPSLVLTT